MFMVFKRKHIVICVCTLLFALSIYIGFGSYVTDEGDKNVYTASKNDDLNELNPGEAIEVSVNNDYFLNAKNDREIVRSRASEHLQGIIDSTSSSLDAKTNAENSIIKMAEDMEKEYEIEKLLEAKGFKKTVAFVTDDKVTLTIGTKLTENGDIAKINDIIYGITGNNNIKIVELN